MLDSQLYQAVIFKLKKKGGGDDTYDSFKETQGQMLVPVRFIYSTTLILYVILPCLLYNVRKNRVKKKVFIYILKDTFIALPIRSTINISRLWF